VAHNFDAGAPSVTSTSPVVFQVPMNIPNRDIRLDAMRIPLGVSGLTESRFTRYANRFLNPFRGFYMTQFNATTLGCSLTCKDVEASIRWYQDVLGFAVTYQFEREGKVAGAIIAAGDIGIVLNQDDGKLGWDRIKGQGLYLQINVAGPADVDAAAGRIKAAGGTLLNEPEDRPWGARMFQFNDLDGFKLGISTPLK
jgi:uncharacterized glyoxalase superfamily protein PhnB